MIGTCVICEEVKQIHAKGACEKCYQKKWRDDNKEKCKIINSKAQKKWRNNNKEKVKKAHKKWRDDNPDKVKQNYEKYCTKHHKKISERQKKRYTKWRENNPKYESKTCKMLKKHHDDMKDDPESLSTEFIQKMIGVKDSVKLRSMGKNDRLKGNLLRNFE